MTLNQTRFCVAILAGVGLAFSAADMAMAAIYNYNETSSTTTQWSPGTSWDATPVSASDTTLTFGDGVTPLPAGVNIVSNNDISGNFLLNQLILQYVGPASGTAPTLTITGNPLEFVDNAGTGPTLSTLPTGTVRPLFTIANDIVLAADLTINTSANIGTTTTLSGKISGSGGMTFTGPTTSSSLAAILVLSNPLNDYAGNTTVYANGTSGGSRTIQLGADDVLPNGAGKGNVVVQTGNSGGRVARLQLNGHNETINGLAGDYPYNAKTNVGTQIVQNGAATDSTLTLGDNNATASFFGTLSNGTTGKLNIVKIGTGTQTLTGATTYTGSTTISDGKLVIDYTQFGSAATSDPADYFGNNSDMVLNGGTFVINGRTDGAATETTGVSLQRYGESLNLPDTIASQLVVGQSLTFTQTGGSGSPAANIFITAFGSTANNSTTVYLSARPGVGGVPIATVTTSATHGTTSQTIKSLTLAGAAASNSAIDFGSSNTVVLTFASAPVQINDGSLLTIMNWSGIPDVGGGEERLMFIGDPTDFTSIFSQSEIIFDGFGAGYQLIPGAGQYEVIPASQIPEPATLVVLAIGGLLCVRRR